MRRCGRRYLILADGGVRVTWDCGAEKVVTDETAIDVEVLADHTADIAHHHKRHLHHKE